MNLRRIVAKVFSLDFFAGLLISASLSLGVLVLLSVGGIGAAIVIGLLGPIVFLIVFALIVMATIALVRENSTKAAGAFAFYPVAFSIYTLFGAYFSYNEDKAQELDFSAHVVANPIGKIDNLTLSDGNCKALCSSVLFEKLADQVTSVYQGAPVILESGQKIPQFEAASYVLARGADCFTPEATIRMSTYYLQSRGAFGVCTVARKVKRGSEIAELLEPGVQIKDGRHHRNEVVRPYGPVSDSIAVGLRVEKGKSPVEIARWEAGSLPHSGKWIGKRFELINFIRALTLDGQGNAALDSEETISDAIARIYASRESAQLRKSAVLEYLRRILSVPHSSKLNEITLSDADIGMILGIRDLSCSYQTFYSNSQSLCLEEFNKFLREDLKLSVQ